MPHEEKVGNRNRSNKIRLQTLNRKRMPTIPLHWTRQQHAQVSGVTLGVFLLCVLVSYANIVQSVEKSV